MILNFKLMYFLGIHPWDRGDIEPASRLGDLVSGLALTPGSRALDLGCGMGPNSLYLARSGFRVTGVDSVWRALRVARERARRASLDIDFVRGDVTRLEKCGVEGPFGLLLDVGCFHAMSDRERNRYGRSLADVAAPGAGLLVMAFGRKKGGVAGPRGADKEDIERSLAGFFALTSVIPEDRAPEFILKNFGCAWYVLRRRP